MLEVNNGWVITDNTWLWKADHCVNSSGMRQKWWCEEGNGRKCKVTRLQIRNPPKMNLFTLISERRLVVSSCTSIPGLVQQADGAKLGNVDKPLQRFILFANKIAMKGRFEMCSPEWVRLVRKVSNYNDWGWFSMCETVGLLRARCPLYSSALCQALPCGEQCQCAFGAELPPEKKDLKKKIEKASNLGNAQNYASSHSFGGGKKVHEALPCTSVSAEFANLNFLHLSHNDQHSMRCICTASWQSIPTAILSFGTVSMAALLPWKCWTVPRRLWSECATRIQNLSMPMHANGWFRLSVDAIQLSQISWNCRMFAACHMLRQDIFLPEWA